MKLFIMLMTILCCAGMVKAQPIGVQLLPTQQSINAGDVAAMLVIDSNTTSASHQILGAFSTNSQTAILGRKLGIAFDALTLATLSYPNSQFFMNFNGTVRTNGQALVFVITPKLNILRGIKMRFVALTWDSFRTNKLHVSPIATVSIQ